MNIKNNFNEILSEFEANVAAPEVLEDFVNILQTNRMAFEYLFETYVNKRIKNNVSYFNLLNLIFNLECHKESEYLSELLNKQLIAGIFRQESLDIFCKLYKYDFRTDRHIIKTLVEQIAKCTIDTAMLLINRMPTDIIDRYELILNVLEVDKRSRILLPTHFLNQFSHEERYLLLVKALTCQKKIFDVLVFQIGVMTWSHDFEKFLLDKLGKNKDEDSLAIALRYYNVDISIIAGNSFLFKILLDNKDNIPETIDRIYYRAKECHCYQLLLLLGVNKNKKELLKDIISSKDNKLLNEFFLVYGKYPEVKHLAPFL